MCIDSMTINDLVSFFGATSARLREILMVLMRPKMNS